MADNSIINVNLFGQEIGRIGLNENDKRSSFQYNPDFLDSRDLANVIPQTGIIRRTSHVQLFSQFDNGTFKGIPPQIADSLPDMFGSIIFKAWLEAKDHHSISVLEQLAYVSNRGMGAMEYSPSKELPRNVTIDLAEIIEVLRDVMDMKKSSGQKKLSNQALINIFRIGSSAGGARPKILISESKNDGIVIPGDLEYSDDYDHYLVKLAIDEDLDYPREVIEYCYYQILRKVGIRIMDSKLIEGKHFATLRFDREDGEKKHVLTASGMTGWDFKDASNSSYENLFKLCSFLKIPHAETEELYKRMIFNIIYGNTDDHLKNHSFIYNRERNDWNLSPVYDVTYALNPLIDFKNSIRALSINKKRSKINFADVLKIAEYFTIKNPRGIIENIQSKKVELLDLLNENGVPDRVIDSISEKIVNLL